MKILSLTAWIVCWTAGAAPAFAGPAVPARATHAAAPARPRPALPFLADDYARAIAEARARKVPLFVEAWAPW